MNQMERYLEEVLRHLLATPEERERFERDLRAHFDAGFADGENAAAIIGRLGAPEAVAEAFNAERKLEYAGFWRRLAAFFGDMSLLVIAALPFAAIGITADRWGISGRPILIIMMVLTGSAIAGVALLYVPLLEWRFGRTLGKHLLRIRVVDEGGRPIHGWQAFVRRLSFYFDLLTVDALFIPFTAKKQRALDILARTIVVREPSREPSIFAWIWGLFGWIVIVAVFALIFLPLT